MIVFEINKQKRQLRNDWEDVSIKQAQRLDNITAPAALVKSWEALKQDRILFEKQNKEVTGEARVKAWREHKFTHLEQATKHLTVGKMLNMQPYWRKVLAVLSNAAEEEIKGLSAEDCLHLITYGNVPHLLRQINAAFPDTYQPQIVKDFMYDGVKYVFPDDKTLINDTQLAGTMDARSFCEILNFHRMGIHGLNGIIAMFARVKPDETFDEKTAIERARNFEGLDMATAWNVFFSLSWSSTTLLSRINMFLSNKTEQAGRLRIIGTN